MLSLAGVLVLSVPVLAQEHPEPKPRPAPAPIAPSKPAAANRDDAIPGLEDADFRLKPAPLRREGAFIVRQRGSMVRLPGGERAFIFHKDASGRAERPMVLMPCLTLQGMEQAQGDRPEESVFIVTGQVYTYRNVNYLLPSAAPMSISDESQSKQTPANESTPAEAKEPGKPDDPAVAELIQDLEAQRGRPRTLGGDGPSKPVVSGSAGLIPEGTMVSLKKGRLVRTETGDWAFAFDNGPSGDPADDRVLVLSPCLNLQRLEAWASKIGDGATVEMSGRVYQYQGRNHLVATMYQITTQEELSPRH